MSESFDAHCVDSWCLAYYMLGGDAVVDNASVFCIEPIQYQRRCLHRENPQRGGKRPRYGGTVCLGYQKGTLVAHIKHGLAVICGHQKGGLSLQPISGGKRIALRAKVEDCRILKRLNFRYKPSELTEKPKQQSMALQLVLF